MSRAIATARLHSIEASPAVRCTCHRSRLACRCSRTSRSGRRTLLDQAEQSFRKALDGARQASMVHGLLEVRGRGCMRERCESAAEACPSQAQAMQQSRSAHLLSIRLEQHGLRSTPRRMSTWSSRNAVVFLSWRSTTSSDSEKLFVVRWSSRLRIEPVGWRHPDLAWSTCSSRKPQHFLSSRWTYASAWNAGHAVPV